MNPIEIERQIAVKLNAAEAAMASAATLLAEANALSTDAFEANYDAAAVAKANAKVNRAGRILGNGKAALADAHKAINAAAQTATFVRPRFGK